MTGATHSAASSLSGQMRNKSGVLTDTFSPDIPQTATSADGEYPRMDGNSSGVHRAIEVAQALVSFFCGLSGSFRGSYDYSLLEHVSDQFELMSASLLSFDAANREACETRDLVLGELSPPKSARSLSRIRFGLIIVQLNALILELQSHSRHPPSDETVTSDMYSTTLPFHIYQSTEEPTSSPDDGEFLIFHMDDSD